MIKVFIFITVWTLTSCSRQPVKPIPIPTVPTDELAKIQKIERDDTFYWGISADVYKLPDSYDVYGLDGFDTLSR